jgi:hypothetical protein
MLELASGVQEAMSLDGFFFFFFFFAGVQTQDLVHVREALYH